MQRLKNIVNRYVGLYGIDLTQHPQAELISGAAGLDVIPERFVGSR